MATVAQIPVRWVTRFPLRPNRSGNPRRKPKGASCSRGAERSGSAAQAASLDNSKQLAISCADYLKATETKWDIHQKNCHYQVLLLRSIEKIVRRLEFDLEAAHDKEPGPEADRAIEAIRKQIERRQKDYNRLQDCQREWIGFKATCCSSAIAVPIGCNHRLCFLCNSHRAEKYRERVRVLFDRLEHPVLMTLTIPNIPKITKRTFSTFRRAFNRLRKEHSGWMQGGICAIETTYNRKAEQAPWHVHAHVLVDSRTALPVCKCRPTGRGRDRKHKAGCEFIRFKRRVEFDWLLLTGGNKVGWYRADFDLWLRQTEREWRDDAARNEWNLRHRRIVYLQRVTDRKGAAYEVLKYVTKASDFCGIPAAVDQFLSAVKGARMLQTFGTWYGFPFPKDVNDWSYLECSCGKNVFERVGKVDRLGVFMNQGRWLMRPEVCPVRGSPPGEVA